MTGRRSLSRRLAAVGALALVLAAVIGVVVAQARQGAPDARGSKSADRYFTAGHGGAAGGARGVRGALARSTAAAGGLSVAKAVGQLIIATYQGTTPPRSILSAIKAGHVGTIILMGDNTGDSVAVTHAATVKLQAAARAGHNPGLLIMTDQEGGEVKRLPGPPAYAAADMSNAKVAGQQGLKTARMLHKAGVNVDLAPVADVVRTDGFISQEQRSFGDKPGVVAGAACSFASALAHDGVAYTLKHFPGLGDAVQSTDTQPVSVPESAAGIHADTLTYRRCGSGPLTLVMVSSASYAHLTGKLPAVLSPKIYQQVIPADKIDAVLISDTLEGGAIKPWKNAALRALNAGLDMVMFPNEESAALKAYTKLVDDARDGSLSSSRLAAAAAKVLALKSALKLG